MEKMFWCVEYMASFVEWFFCTYFCGTFILKDKAESIKGKAIALSVVGAGMTVLLNQIQFFSHMTTIFFIFLCTIVQWIYYKKGYLLSIGLVLVYIVVLSLIDFITLYFISFIMNTNINYLVNEQSFTRLVGILLSKSVLIIIIVSLKKVISHRNFIPSLYIVIMGLCSIFLFVSNMVLIHLELTLEDVSNFTIIFFIASFGMEMIIFFLVLKIAESQEQRQNHLLIEMHNKMLQKSLEETKQNFDLWKHSIHDYKNHMIILKQMADDGRLEAIQSYLEKENELMKKNMFYIKTGNSVADTIINLKRNIAEKQNILFVVHANLSSDMQITDMDMANMLGNLLDNAIEASIKEEAPYIDMVIKQEKNFFLLNIKNKCTKIAKKGFGKTSKQDTTFHGIGLQSVKKTVKKYNGEINIEQENQEYIVDIMIQNQ